MTKFEDTVQKWKKSLQDPKRRLQAFCVSLVLIYFVWAFLFLNPVLNAKKQLATEILTLQAQSIETKQKIDTLNEALTHESLRKNLAVKKQLESRLKQTEQALGNAKYLFISLSDWIKLKEEIINQQKDMDKNITLISINDSPVRSWVPPTIDKADTTKVLTQSVYQHELELKFQADYFSAIRYIERLEKLPWPVYWDSLSYDVLTYPKAEVTVKFHIFTHEKSEV